MRHCIIFSWANNFFYTEMTTTNSFFKQSKMCKMKPKYVFFLVLHLFINKRIPCSLLLLFFFQTSTHHHRQLALDSDSNLLSHLSFCCSNILLLFISNILLQFNLDSFQKLIYSLWFIVSNFSFKRILIIN